MDASKYQSKGWQANRLTQLLIFVAVLLITCSWQSGSSYAQMPDLDFGKEAARPDGLWIDRSNSAPLTKPRKHHYRSQQQDKRTPVGLGNSQGARQGQARGRSYPPANYGAGMAAAQNNIQSEELAPLPGTAHDKPQSFPQTGGKSRFENTLPPAQQAKTAQGYNNINPLSGRVWQDISMGQLEQVLPHLKLPLLSFTYQNLLARLFLSDSVPPSGSQQQEQKFLSMRLNVLYRAGLVGSLQAYLKNISLRQRTPLTKLYAIKAGFALGRTPSHLCEDLSDIAVDPSAMPKDSFGELILYRAYCSALEGQVQASQLSIELVREQGIQAKIPFAVIEYMSGMGSPNFPVTQKLLLRDYLFLSLSKQRMPANLLQTAEPALLHYISHDRNSPENIRVRAAEQVVKMDLQDSRQLAKVYKTVRKQGAPNSALRRANIFQSILDDQQPQRKARKMQLLLQNAKKNNLAMPIAKILLTELKKITPQKHMDWFAHDATEIAILAKDFPLAMRWIIVSKRQKAGTPGAVANLLVLMEIADPSHTLPKKSGLLSAEDLANASHLQPHVLHRLVTVLDALEYNIPIPLWEAASKTPQPQKGYLPPSGALSSLRSAAKAKAPARTILMAIEATGNKGAGKVHLIGLRDIIQNLRKAGYEQAARDMGFEALYAIWPRQ